MATYYSLRDGLITDTSTYGNSISNLEKITNTTAYTLISSDSWSPVLSSSNTDVIDSIAVHLSSRAANPVGVLSAEAMRYAGAMVRGSTNTTSFDTPFNNGLDGSMSLDGTAATTFSRISQPITFDGDFTIELWIYPTALGTANRILCECFASNPTSAGWQLFYRGVNGQSITFLVNNSTAAGSVLQDPSSTTLSVNNWYHVAVTREGNNTRLYINGVHRHNVTAPYGNIVSTAPFNIGNQNFNTSNGFAGRISNVRIVKGFARYTGTGTFTVSNAPLPIVDGTELLLQFPYNFYKNRATYSLSNIGTYPISSFTPFGDLDNTLITNSLNWQLLKLSTPFTNTSRFFSLNLKTSNLNQLSLMGLSSINGVDYNIMAIPSSSNISQPTISDRGNVLLESTIKPYSYFNNSLYLSASTGTATSYLEAPANPNFNLNEDFTIECWINVNAIDINSLDNGDSRRVFSFSRTSADNNLSLAFWGGTPTAAASPILGLWANGLRINGSITVADGNWHHVALSRSNGAIRLFVDGVQSGATYNSTLVYDAGATNSLFIFCSNTTGGRLKGYLNEFRIINGRGLYTQNFTPPTQTLENVLGTVLLLKTGTNNAQKIIQQNIYPLYFTDSIHIGGILSGSSVEVRSMTASSITLPNLYVHDKGILSFPENSSTFVTINGLNGLNVNTGGTLNIGTSSNPILSSTTHTILLSNTNILINTDSTFNSYGSNKVPYGYLAQDSLSSSTRFIASQTLSSDWLIGDAVLFTNNSNGLSTFDSLVLSGFESGDTFRTTTSARFLHNSLSSNPYVPNISNLTRNVKLSSNLTDNFSQILFKTKNKNIKNTEFSNLLININDEDGDVTNISNSVFKNGLFYNNKPSFVRYFPIDSYVNIASTTSLQFGTGDFTMECWLYYTSRMGYRLMNARWGGSSEAKTWSWNVNNGVISFSEVVTGEPNVTSGSLNIRSRTWNHVAVSRQSGTLRLFLNGKIIASGSFNRDIGTTRTIFIGAEPGLATASFNGYLSNVRMVKGQALYTTDFTPPTGTLGLTHNGGATPSINPINTNVGLLTFINSRLVDSSPNNNVITNVGTIPVYSAIYPYNIKELNNFNINNNIFITNHLLSYDSTILKNCNITNNFILSNINTAVTLTNLSCSNINMSNNYVTGLSGIGTLIQNCSGTGSIGGTINFNGTRGAVISGNNPITISNIGSISSRQEGIYVDSSSNLSNTTFRNITAVGNTLNGMILSGNDLNYLTPITVNIDGLLSNDNFNAGFKAYNISGNLSSIVANNNFVYGIETSIGNGATIFDGVTTLNTNPTGLPLTKTGTTLSSASPFASGVDSSIRFNGTSDTITVPAIPSMTGDFTIELWFNCQTDTIVPLLDNRTGVAPNPFWLGLNNSGNVATAGRVTIFTDNTTVSLSGYGSFTKNTWNHIAVCRVGSIITLYLNGENIHSRANSLTWGGNILNIGKDYDGRWYNGFISNIRIVNGTALYTANFNTQAPITPRTPLSIVPNTAFLYNSPYGLLYKNSSSTMYGLAILSGYNYGTTTIKNALLSSNNLNYIDYGLFMDSTRFSRFSLDNSVLSTTTPLQLNISRNLLEGSYLINNSILGSTPLGTGIVSKYQPYAIRATGFAFTNINKIQGSNVTYYAHGERSTDNIIANNITQYPSERLTPYSNTAKMRSGSKFVALNANDSTVVRVSVRKSISTGGETEYNGNPPRLILSRNPSVGIYSDVVLDELTSLNDDSGSFIQLVGVTQPTTNDGVLEFYVDCDGTQGWINIDNWEAN